MVREGYLYTIRDGKIISKDAVIYYDKKYVYIKRHGSEGLDWFYSYHIVSQEKFLQEQKNNPQFYINSFYRVYVPNSKKFNYSFDNKPIDYKLQVEVYLGKQKRILEQIQNKQRSIDYYEKSIPTLKQSLELLIKEEQENSSKLAFWQSKLLELESEKLEFEREKEKSNDGC